jgi:SAM-dependent methyltransferase
MPNRSRARELCAEYSNSANPLAWFDKLYREAERGETVIPWDDRAPNPHLLQCREQLAPRAMGHYALVVGCGLGDDGEEVAYLGFGVTAFDISPTATQMAKDRFPHTRVDFIAADLFSAPAAWRHRFDFVFESNTLQTIPAAMRPQAFKVIADFLAPNGLLLVIARAREESESIGELPWPLTRSEFSAFRESGLIEESFRDVVDAEPPHTRRFHAPYTRR